LNHNQYLKPVIQIPSSLIITNITQSLPMTVSVAIQTPSTEANTYIVGMAVRLFVPYNYGMFQANGLVGTITAINGNTWTLNLDSSQFDPFVIPATGEQPASVSPNGSRNLQYNNQTGQVPFQSLNNIGN
jgi:hypothetical protein